MSKELDQAGEQKINNILFYLCLFVTLLAMAMMLVEFFSRGQFPPTKISTFYFGVLLLYSFHKESLRWLEEKSSALQKRNGEYFIYGWIIITALLYLINFLTRGYFNYPQGSTESPALIEISFTVLEVCAVFIITRLSKVTATWLLKKR